MNSTRSSTTDSVSGESTNGFKTATMEEVEALTHKIPPWYSDSDSRKLVVMSVLTFFFMLAEFGFGLYAGSLALVADASHMLSDQLSLIIGFISIQIKKREKTNRYSYGWERAEVIGALINGVFLFSATIYIILEAISRFIEPVDISNPKIVLIVAAGGLLVNIIGIFMFMGGGGGHGHGHSHGHSHGDSHSHGHSHGGGNRLNMQGVFLHVLGDALGSIGAMATGLLIWRLKWKYRFYLDPVCSLFISAIILKSSIPLVKKCIKILMQSVPENVELEKVRNTLSSLKGVHSVHDLHVWQLTSTKVIGTLHIAVKHGTEFQELASSIKKIMHGYGVHSFTVQPEFMPPEKTTHDETDCALACEEEVCKENMCCEPRKSSISVEKRKITGKVELP